MQSHIPFNIYLIGEKNFFSSENEYLDTLKTCFDNGIKAFQLRQKDLSVRQIINIGKKIKKIIEQYKDIYFFVNDRIDIALALEANGVHLNKNSIPIKAAKEKYREMIIFYSSHSYEEALDAEKNGADAITFSPIFKTKNQDFEQGLEPLKKIINNTKIPVFALGGINNGNIQTIRNAGARYAAIQSGILKQKNIKGSIKIIQDILK
ncbi:MAG: thiamine phosphate synthase [Candidatus Acididesulfobacter diazotrophicus]|uniref:Thiamine-phosphate synthase n=1 Tax=Candidatus Acididesulfobacter diazotrophicus TaxID=2597226 RepID=A0A519BNX6_9DELT|nr:MAG: thiamine phosphate synthase [Candidatus Acididesulfobacter diazotrophicus]